MDKQKPIEYDPDSYHKWLDDSLTENEPENDVESEDERMNER